MDPAEKRKEFENIVARAKRAGVLKAHYPEAGIAVLELPPAPPPSDPPLSSSDQSAKT